MKGLLRFNKKNLLEKMILNLKNEWHESEFYE